MRFKLMNSGFENWSWGREQGNGDSAAPERCGEGTGGVGAACARGQSSGPENLPEFGT